MPSVWVWRSALPTSTPQNMAHCFKNLDEASQQECNKLTAMRDTLLRALDSSTSFDALTTAANNYLPWLCAVLRATETMAPALSAPLNFSWCMPYTVRYARTPATATSLRFEHAMVMLSLAFSYRKRASEILSSNFCSSSSSTSSSSTSGVDGGNEGMMMMTITDGETIKQSASLLCKAAGVFDWLSSQPLMAWANSLICAETNTEFHSAWSSVCLLEAQELTLRKGLTGGNVVISGGTAAKLMREISRRAGEAASVFEKLAKAGEGVVSGDEMRLRGVGAYLVGTSAVYRGWMHRVLGVAAYNEMKKGVAVAHLAEARPTDQESKMLFNKKQLRETVMPEFMKGVTAEVEETVKLYNAYSKENSTVYFETVPKPAQLTLPDPAMLAKPSPYIPPEPAPLSIHFKDSSSCSIQ